MWDISTHLTPFTIYFLATRCPSTSQAEAFKAALHNFSVAPVEKPTFILLLGLNTFLHFSHCKHSTSHRCHYENAKTKRGIFPKKKEKKEEEAEKDQNEQIQVKKD